LVIDIGQNLRGDDVVATLTRVCGLRGMPRVIKADNGSERISKAMDK
jgi:putative transposase